MISLVALPLFAWGRGGRGGAFLQRFARRLARPAWWLLAAFLMLVGEALPDPAARLFYYLVFFVLGYLVVCDAAFIKSAERYRLPALALGVGLCRVVVAQRRTTATRCPTPRRSSFALIYAGHARRRG